MTTVDLKEWAHYILPDIPTAPMPAIISNVRDAARDFCERTLLWTYPLARMSTVIGQQDYTLTIPAATYGAIISVDDVKYKRTGELDTQFVTLDPLSENNRDLVNTGSWKFVTGPDPKEYWADIIDKNLHLLPIPTTASTLGLLVRVNLKPTFDCTTVPEFLHEDYALIIAEAALSYLFNNKSMEWYDPNQAAAHEAKFVNGCNNAKTKKITGATKRPLRVQMRPWV